MLICGNIEKGHDAIFAKVMERALKCNIRFNKNKVQYELREERYFGHILSKDGIKVDPNRVLAITEIKSPKNKKGLQVFLAMVIYLRKFVPNLANTASPLQRLLKKKNEWVRTDVHEKAFINMKHIIK